MSLSLKEVQEISKKKHRHFFDGQAIEFWGSKIHSKELIKEKYFITSEDNFQQTKRFFTVREFDVQTGKVETIGKFQQFETLEEAEKYIQDELS